VLQLLIARCQDIAGPLADNSSDALADRLDALVRVLPSAATAPERLMIRGLMSHVLSRIISVGILGTHHVVVKSISAWTSSVATSDAWRAELCSIIKCCTSALRHQQTHPHIIDPRIMRALRLLDARFHDNSFTAKVFASELRLSPWHACRLLKAHTGLPLSRHVHNRRVQAAIQLLRDDRLTVKEIAAAVGYGHTTQLGRHFKHIVGRTPVEHRRSLLAANAAA